MTAGYCGSPDCTGTCAPALLPRCADCAGVMTPFAAGLAVAVFGAQLCESCGWASQPPAAGRAW